MTSESNSEISLAANDEEIQGQVKNSLTRRINLSREQETALFEILRCAVCLEIPKDRPPKVQTCKNGHHFCLSCHKKLQKCAVCRASLLLCRNFVVEEIISKFGLSLGIVKPIVDSQPVPYDVGVGLFSCPLECGESFPAIKVLNHVRNKHKNDLVDNIQSNVYTLRLDWKTTIKFKPNTASIFCLQVSDLGLLKIKISFNGPDLQARVLILRREEVYPAYKYRMTLKHSNSGFFLDEAPVCGWYPKVDSPAFNIAGSLLPAEETDLEIFVTIFRSPDAKIMVDDGPYQAEDFGYQTSDRKLRRNRNRNIRKRRVKAAFREILSKDVEELDPAWQLDDTEPAVKVVNPASSPAL